MKTFLIPWLMATAMQSVVANVAPTPVVVSAAMRSGTTFMDVVYRVNDQDDATVKVRALAFINGIRSFTNVLRPVTFAEGTAAKLGDAIPTNVNHTLTWDVSADWNIDLGQVKFEILCRDGRGLLAFDWITIPAAGGQPALKISKDSPSNAEVLNALFWHYADRNPALTLTNGLLSGSPNAGAFSGLTLASESSAGYYSTPFVLKSMNLAPAGSSEVAYGSTTARAGLLNTAGWHAANRPYSGFSIVAAWGNNNFGQTTFPNGLIGGTTLSAVAASNAYTNWEAGHSLALRSDGTVIGWGNFQGTIPAGLANVTAIAAGGQHSLALRSDGTVVGWGSNSNGQSVIPTDLSNVTAIAAGGLHSLALKNDGTVIGWGGLNSFGQAAIPTDLSGVTAISAGGEHSLALKSDGTVVGWGKNLDGQSTIPAGLTNVVAISAGGQHSLALRSNGTVVAWGQNTSGQTVVPAGLSGVTAISAGGLHCLAIKSGGIVVGWGNNYYQQATSPSGTAGGVTAIAAGGAHSLALKSDAP